MKNLRFLSFMCLLFVLNIFIVYDAFADDPACMVCCCNKGADCEAAGCTGSGPDTCDWNTFCDGGCQSANCGEWVGCGDVQQNCGTIGQH